jgi:hypothetical protein
MRAMHKTANGTSLLGWWCVGNLLLIVCSYGLFVLWPSFGSGLYRASRAEIWANDWDVPLYEGQYWGTPMFYTLGMAAIMAAGAAKFVTIPLSLLVLVSAYLARRTVERKTRLLWLAIIVAVQTVVWTTQSATQAFFIWYFD